MTEPKQCTIRTNAGLSGRGLHTGESCSITLHPANIGTGIVFRTTRGSIPATIEHLSDTRRGTSLSKGDAEVHTVEHLLAALSGLGVDNALIEITGPEVPAADGSALPFVEIIEDAGIQQQDAPARVLLPKDLLWINAQDKHMISAAARSMIVRAFISFAHPLIGDQALCWPHDRDSFKKEIAPARTFCTSSEIDTILSAGLGRGGTKDNVVVVYDDDYSIPLRFADEFVRHKILDLIGDLALIGGRLTADVTAIKSSHALNTALAQRIVEAVRSSTLSV